MPNLLGKEKSPYLLQHRDNPVNWHPWSNEAFEKAKSEDKPIFLSIGYSTCHWCHVMAHESFEDEEVARILNRDFVCIKVDREERPDVDAVYMTVCQIMTGSGGWPLTVFLTPEQKPFFAGTYFPKQSMCGQYGLVELLEQVAYMWQNERRKLLAAGSEITAAVNQCRRPGLQEPDRPLLCRAYGQFRKQFDKEWGSFGSAPKFPTPHNLLFLVRYAAVENQPDALEMAEITLEAMARGGIQDHIGGGFSRYSTDREWLVPHFEKMLYDNALLTLAYINAYQITRKPLYAKTARATADYILRELSNEGGGFFCGQDADSEGVEGKYYVFTPSEIINVLGQKDGKEFCRLYGITESGNFKGNSIPNRIRQSEDGWNIDDPRLRKLCDYRKKRTDLHKDDKILLAWNAWTIIALVQAGQILGQGRYLNLAIRAQEFIEREMTDENDRLYLRWRDGEAAHAGQLEDYAVYALALLELYRMRFEVKYLTLAIKRARQMVELFEDKENGGYFINASDSEQLISRPKETYDGAVPSGNSAAAAALQALAMLTGESEWMTCAHRQLRFLAGDVWEYPSNSALGMLATMDALYPHRTLICASSNGIPDQLADFLRSKLPDDIQIILKTTGNAKELANCAPFTTDYPVPESGAVYYLCENGACKAPATDFEKLNLG